MELYSVQNIDRIYSTILNILLIPFLALLLFTACSKKESATLTNQNISIQLAMDNNGVPFIQEAREKPNGKVIFTGNPTDITLEERLPANLLSGSNGNGKKDKWNVTSDSISSKALLTKTLDELQVTWYYQLMNNSSVLKTWISFKNTGPKITIPWYPIWQGSLDFGNRENKLKFWEALEYTPHQKSMTSDSGYTLQSHVYSSDPGHGTAHLPYWRVSNDDYATYFGISWSGGWETEVAQNGTATHFNVKLPEEETQLSLLQGEEIAGPKLLLTMIENPEKIPARTRYFQEKRKYAHLLYDMPESSFPLVYNHWYATRFDLSGDFITNQVKALKDYDFDVFVVDAGWYESVGNWSPARKKFKSGEFENALQQVKANKIDVGIWTSPWLIQPGKASLPEGMDTTSFYRDFMESYAIDMTTGNYTGYLIDHINQLKSGYHMDWWKYDQEFMGIKKGVGNVKNIIALQNALKAVRQNNPDLYIENCMSGGRMINDFTNTLAQIHWIRDGGNNGLEHARENIKTALGASEILPLSKVERWTNRVNEIRDPELLKYYCRSAMIGVWGISADMHEITPAQKKIILEQVDHYRKLNKIKAANVYRIIRPEKDNLAAIAYYNDALNQAALMVFRWQKQGPINQNIQLEILKEDQNYTIEEVNSDKNQEYQGDNLKEQGLPVTLGKGVMSKIYYVNKVN